jgi:hypothetical protein
MLARDFRSLCFSWGRNCAQLSRVAENVKGGKTMQITYSYAAGPRVVVDVLAVGADCIRLAEPGRAEGLRLYLKDDEWVTETGCAVRVESILLGQATRH